MSPGKKIWFLYSKRILVCRSLAPVTLICREFETEQVGTRWISLHILYRELEWSFVSAGSSMLLEGVSLAGKIFGSFPVEKVEKKFVAGKWSKCSAFSTKKCGVEPKKLCSSLTGEPAAESRSRLPQPVENPVANYLTLREHSSDYCAAA